MEAMKMEHTITAPRDGVVAELLYAVGDQVPEGGELLKLTESLESSDERFPSQVSLVEVGPRDGLQNEKQPVATATQDRTRACPAGAGLREIEVTSFVSPKWVPQMGDNAEVMAGIRRQPGVRYAVLTPNLKGWEAALPTRPDEIVVFGAASEAFSQKNINCSIAESIERFAPVGRCARRRHQGARAISCAVGCPYEGEIAPSGWNWSPA
jgi:hydroxymethylglutaryl-CoA lyase